MPCWSFLRIPDRSEILPIGRPDTTMAQAADICGRESGTQPALLPPPPRIRLAWTISAGSCHQAGQMFCVDHDRRLLRKDSILLSIWIILILFARGTQQAASVLIELSIGLRPPAASGGL